MNGERHSVTLTMGPVPAEFLDVYERRRITPPLASTPHDPAALVPYRFRSFHQRYADAVGYYWHPCVLCLRPHGGHEIGETIPDPTRQPDGGMTICPACAADRNGGRP